MQLHYKEALAQVFSGVFSKIPKNTYFVEHLQNADSVVFFLNFDFQHFLACL